MRIKSFECLLRADFAQRIENFAYCVSGMVNDMGRVDAATFSRATSMSPDGREANTGDRATGKVEMTLSVGVSRRTWLALDRSSSKEKILVNNVERNSPKLVVEDFSMLASFSSLSSFS